MAPGKDSAGVLPAEEIAALIEAGAITADVPVEPRQVQPASLDLRLGTRAHRLRASFLPGPGRRVADRLDDMALHEIDLTRGAVLETGCVYLVPLRERLRLPARIAGRANPKSSTGRIDVFTRLIGDGAREFDALEAGYEGPLYAEISPRTFPVVVRAGSSLAQLRLRRGAPALSDAQLRHLHAQVPLVDSDPVIGEGVALSADLEGAGEGAVIGWRAKRHAGLIDVDAVGALDPHEFWEPIARRARTALVLDPGEFYILASREAVAIPAGIAAEMVPIDPQFGEFRVHYAGFFDPGFGLGAAGGEGARIVLEVRSHDVPFMLDHGQIVGRVVYERLSAAPAVLYGARPGSHYQGQGLKLSKHFRAP